MRILRFVLHFALVLLFVSSVLSCGNTHGQLRSITVTPASAAGQAQFTASGAYSDGSKISPLPVLWSEGNPWVTNDLVPEEYVITESGMASCNPVVGTFTVEATAPADPRIPISQMTITTPQVHGTARITCP